MYRLYLHQCFPILLILINKFMVCCGELDFVKNHDGSKLYKSPTMFVYGNGYKNICSYCPRQYFSDVRYYSDECKEQYIQHNKSLNISGNNRTYHRVCRQFTGEKDFMNDVDCTFPLDIQNGTVSLVHNYLGSNDYPVYSRRPVIGTVIEVVCNSGYTPVNDTIAVCQVEKSKPRWSQELACKRTGCFRDIFKETNGEVKCTNISDKELIANDTVCFLKCFDGFEAKITTTTCLQGEWSERLNCLPKTDTSVSIVIVVVIPVMILIGIFVVIIIVIWYRLKKRNKKDYVNVSFSSNAEDPVVQILDGKTSENPGEQNPHGEAPEVVADSGSCDSASPPTQPSISGIGMPQSDISSKTDLSLISDPELNDIQSLPREGEEHEEDINHDASCSRKDPVEHAELVDETEVKQILRLEPWKQDKNPSPGGKKLKELELDEIKHHSEETKPKKIDEQDETFGSRHAVNGEHRMLNRREENGLEENGRQPEQVSPPTRDSGVEGSNDLLSSTSLLPSNPRLSDFFITQNGEDNPSTGFPETNNHYNPQFRMPSSEMTKLLKTNPEPLIPADIKE